MVINKVINYALEHNSSIIDVARTEEDQEDAYDEAKRTYQNWKNKLRFDGGYSFETAADFLDCWGHSYELAELQYESFLASKESAESVTMEGTTGYQHAVKTLNNKASEYVNTTYANFQAADTPIVIITGSCVMGGMDIQ